MVAVHRFFESMLNYFSREENQTSFYEAEFDHFKFVTHELFLYALANYFSAEDYGSANHLLTEQYYVSKNVEQGRKGSYTFTILRSHLQSLKRRNDRLQLRRLSLHSDLLEQRSKSSGVPFRHLMQADFICFMRAELTNQNQYDRWWLETLLYATRHYGPFEVFVRAVSRIHLTRLMPLLGVTTIAEIKSKLGEFRRVVQHSFCNFPDDCTFALQSVVERSETKLCSANARRADVASTRSHCVNPEREYPL